MYQTLLVLHVLGATVWTGGHLVLTLGFLPGAVKTRDVTALQAFEARFERIGIPALVVQVLTGLELARRYLPPSEWLSFDGLLARHVGVKLVLLAVTLGLALHARLRLVPKLDGSNVRALAVHVVLITLVSVLFVVVGIGFRTGGVV